MTNEQLHLVIDKAKKRHARDGYVGMDFNMTAFCIARERLGILTYANNIGGTATNHYWINRRFGGAYHFGHAVFASEDAVLERMLQCD